MNLIKTSVLTTISTIIKILSGFLINKMMAIYIGPAGLAMVGPLQNFNTFVTTLSNGAITQGVVKYVAEYDTLERKKGIFSTSVVVSLLCSFSIGVILFIFNLELSILILKSDEYASVFTLFSFTIVLFALNTMLMAILNGQKEIKKYVYINIVNSLVILILTYLLIVELNIIGVFYALVTGQSVVFFITLFFVIKAKWFRWEYFLNGPDRKSLVKLSKFSLMALTSAITVPVSHIIIRNYIGENLSWSDAGYWQGMWYISTMYLLIITTALSVYYLPRLSSISEKKYIKKEIIYGYKIVIPIAIVLSLLVYTFRYAIIEVAFTADFYQMEVLFKWQLIGDIIKIFAWILGYVLIAKAMSAVYIYTEIIFSILFVLSSIYFLDKFGLIGMSYSFAFYNLIYSIYLIVILNVYFFNKSDAQ